MSGDPERCPTPGAAPPTSGTQQPEPDDTDDDYDYKLRHMQ